MERFWELLEESVILQATLTIIMAVLIAVLVLTGREIPDIVSTSFAVVLGFYFGAKTEQKAKALASKIRYAKQAGFHEVMPETEGMAPQNYKGGK